MIAGPPIILLDAFAAPASEGFRALALFHIQRHMFHLADRLKCISER